MELHFPGDVEGEIEGIPSIGQLDPCRMRGVQAEKRWSHRQELPPRVVEMWMHTGLVNVSMQIPR